ncbi:hypothetical protein Ciccas_007463 [Cichlidogyrus casuarinus]|uniref:Uncharacterized protein n=1 Tax=Cichlidogyrus casuarinus TaxID=1844966 RepID=A0ABD2Q2Z4_9PLAT
MNNAKAGRGEPTEYDLLVQPGKEQQHRPWTRDKDHSPLLDERAAGVEGSTVASAPYILCAFRVMFDISSHDALYASSSSTCH